MAENKFIAKFKAMSFEEKKVEIMRLLKDLVEHSVRAKALVKIVPDLEETAENTEKLIIDYSDIIYAIEKVDKDKEEEKKQKIEEEAKKLEENQKILAQKMKNEKEESEEDLDDLDDLFKDI